MKKLLLLFITAIGIVLSPKGFSQLPPTSTQYVAAKTGLSIREKPEVNGKVLDKIPYGTKVEVSMDYDQEKTISVEGMKGYWRKVKYNNKTGYIIDSYLFPYAPPKAT